MPRDVLRDLPLALGCDDLALVASHNQALRDKVNELIGSTWRKAANYASKKDVRAVMLKYPEILSDLIEQYRRKAWTKYDFDEDRAGQVVWHEAANVAAAEHLLQLMLTEKPTIGDVAAVVTAIPNAAACSSPTVAFGRGPDPREIQTSGSLVIG